MKAITGVFALLIAVVAVTVAFAVSDTGDTEAVPDPAYTTDGLSYQFDEENRTASVYGSSYATGNVVIPSETAVGGIAYTVTEIGDYAFGDSSITSVTIPDTVTTIGDNAFRNCSSLASLTLPISLSATSGFTGVTSLTMVTFTAGTGEGYDYSGYRETGSYYSPERVYYYEETPWYQSRESLTSVTLEDGIVSIGADTLRGCSAVASISVPGSVTSIGEDAFGGCSSITSLTVPINLDSASAFPDVSDLTTLVLAPGTGAGFDYDYDDKTPWSRSGSSLESVTLEDGIASIGENTFRDSYLEAVVIPASVEKIGDDAFESCGSLVTVDLEGNVSEIGYGAFHECSSLETVSNLNFVKTIGPSAFWKCTNLKEADLRGAEKIGHSAFAECEFLQKISFGDSLEYVGDNVFGDIIFYKSDRVTAINDVLSNLRGNSFAVEYQKNAVMTGASEANDPDDGGSSGGTDHDDGVSVTTAIVSVALAAICASLLTLFVVKKFKP